MRKRQIKILELLSEKKKIEVKELAVLCNVSEVTIRKDLDILNNLGFLIREHGFAILNNEDNIKYRLAIGYPEKHAIALKALKLINPNETVMIESGSSSTLLALEIAKRDQNNTIITNSTFIARYLSDYPSTQIILVGGKYQSHSEALVGPLINCILEKFNVKKIFLGTDGIDMEFGFTSSDHERSEAVKTMATHAKEIYVLSESLKLNQYASFSLFKLNEVDYLITDNKLSNKDKKQLSQYLNVI